MIADHSHDAFLRALASVGADCRIMAEPEQLVPYECDGLTTHRARPMAVVLPSHEADVVAVLRCCHRFRVPVVARGAGTGLSGGAMPVAGGIVLSLARLDRIVQIDAAARVATVQPGVRNLAISEAAAPFGLYYAPDPSSQIACTIGGNVAENSGGVHCLKYGLTLHNVLRVRAVTFSGEIVEFGSLAPDVPGLDLLAILIGSEGMFAVVTEISVRLLPRAECARVILASFADVRSAGGAVAAIIASGLIPAGLEMMDQGALIAADDFAEAGYDRSAAALLLCESDGTSEEVDAEIEAMVAQLTAQGATRIAVSSCEAERLRFWSGRKNAFPAAGRLSPDYYCMDGTVPRRHIGELLDRIQQMSARYGLRCINVFHAGDGNLHPLILFNGGDDRELRLADEFGAEILETCVALGGTVTGEHGVGVEKLNSMCVQFSTEEHEVFAAVKRAFDPDALLNPGKAIPTRARCAEYGRQHVQRGALSFPHLPRF